jgi:hypothetical protein
MPNSDDFELFLPRLRRLARMLADDQQGGDAVVAATLETLADEEKLQADPRIALYRAPRKIALAVPRRIRLVDRMGQLLDGAGGPWVRRAFSIWSGGSMR